MKLYNSDIIKNIFSNLEKENRTIITEITGKSISSFDFKNNILSVAKNLSDFWLWKTDKVGIFVRDNIAFSNIIISSILCGAQVILLDPGMWKKILLEKINASKVTHIFIEWILYDYLFLRHSEIFSMNIVFIIEWWSLFGRKHKKCRQLLKSNDSSIDFVDADENNDCITVFTWGTTGKPQWVIHSLASIFAMLSKIKYFIGDTKIFYADMPHFLLLWLLVDAHIISGSYNIKPRKLKFILEKYKIDTYFCPPYKYNYFIENNLKVPNTLTNILLGSAPIYTWFLEKLLPLLDEQQKVTCIYGMTEMLPIAYIDGREKVATKVDGDLLGNIIDEINHNIVENELQVQGPHQMLHYLWYDTKPFIETWDLVRIQHNKLVMIGRKKDMIIRKEYNIYPWVYEPIICQIPWVFHCALVWMYDEKLNDEKIILFVEMWYSHKKYNQNYIMTQLKSWEYSIDEYALPDEIIFCILPRIWRQNKIDKIALRDSLKSIF